MRTARMRTAIPTRRTAPIHRTPGWTAGRLRAILGESNGGTNIADVFIYDALRTPRGRGKAGKGGLSNHHPQELLAQTLNHMAERKKLDKNLVDDLAVGCVTQVKEQ